jgi:DNA-binding CsgD family transcriptional regulator
VLSGSIISATAGHQFGIITWRSRVDHGLSFRPRSGVEGAQLRVDTSLLDARVSAADEADPLVEVRRFLTCGIPSRGRMGPSRARRPRGQRAPAGVLERRTRKQHAERIESLSKRGLGSEEIAERLGLARSTVNKYRRDPEGERERARRERYRGRCRGCGRPTRGSDGPGRAPEWCPECAPLQRRRWRDDQVLDAVRAWTRLTGAPPTLYDWSPAHAHAGHRGAARYLAERGRWLNASSVSRRFGSLRAAVEAAGVGGEPRRR